MPGPSCSSFTSGWYVPAKFGVENQLGGPQRMLLECPLKRSFLLRPSVPGTSDVLRSNVLRASLTLAGMSGRLQDEAMLSLGPAMFLPCMKSSVEALAREDEWVSYIYGELDETSLYVMRRHGDLAPIYGEAPAAMTASREYAEKHLAVVAEHMTGKDFVVGDQLGLADIMLVSCLDWAVHYDFELQASLLRYRDLHRSRQAYRRAFDVNYRASS